MIPATTLGRQPAPPSTWQHELAGAITDPEALARALDLDPGLFPAAGRASALFALRVPLGFVSRMRRGDPTDPLLLQVMPVAAELVEQPGFGADPLAERAAVKAPGLLQKYQGRALLIASGACAVNCRFCFRREFPYAEQLGIGALSQALDAIALDPGIEEVILSGGDPLSLSNARLRAITDRLARIPHIRRLRLHTRLPVVLPARVDAGLIEWLRHLPWPVAVVLHTNHGNEIDDSLRAACARLRAAGVTLLNQTVLLRGINDSLAALSVLSQRLFAAGVVPYYLHLLDRVRGVAHFEVPEATAQRLIGELASTLSGYLVPRLVREVPGGPAKMPLGALFSPAENVRPVARARP
ncbi:MAG TPA: EF-P beta-lysylation protein EpmB [Steroidobacteraceae bacterium]|jgi:EF-P beta-lysylation protein EpmB|nr:EF-P beta-lysylation protein EpmB [Steroidobacteraceae bacterium]